MGGASATPPPRADAWRAGAALALVTALGLLVRLYRLPEQSVWHDEFLALCHFNAPDLSRHLALMDLCMPFNMKSPLYYILQYGFARHVSDSLLALRLVAVALGVLCIPVLFLLVRRICGVRPALFAALLLALSPQHVWYSQEVRPYALSCLLALGSFYCFWRAVEGGGRRWWAASLLVNALLPWAHLMFSLAVFAEGCYLLGRWRSKPLRTAAWAALQFSLMVPMVFFLLPLPFEQDAPSPAGVADILTAFFAVDAVGLYSDFMPDWKSTPPDFPGWTDTLLIFQPPANMLLGVFFAAALVIALGGALRRKMPGAGFFLALWVAPPALLAALNLATQGPFLSHMYFMYCAAGMYAAAGMLVCIPRRAVVRGLFAAGVAALYAYNLALLLPFPTRTDWRAAAEHVIRHREPNDRMVNLEFFGPTNPLEYYRESIGLPVERASTVAAACDAVFQAFHSPGGGAPKHVWVVYRGLFRRIFFPLEDTERLFRERLGACRIRVTAHRYPGQYTLVLLKAERLPEGSVEGCDPSFPGDEWGHEALLDALDPGGRATGDREQALRVLRRVVGWPWPEAPPLIWASCVLDLVAADRADLAAAAARWQLERRPRAAPLHFALAVAHYAQARPAEAGESFEAAYRLQPSLRLLTGPLVASLLRGDRTGARRELERMRPWGWAYYIPVFDYLLREPAPVV